MSLDSTLTDITARLCRLPLSLVVILNEVKNLCCSPPSRVRRDAVVVYSNHEKHQAICNRIRLAAEVAGLTFGKDIIVEI